MLSLLKINLRTNAGTHVQGRKGKREKRRKGEGRKAFACTMVREGKGREGKGRERKVKGREEKEENGREGKGRKEGSDSSNVLKLPQNSSNSLKPTQSSF